MGVLRKAKGRIASVANAAVEKVQATTQKVVEAGKNQAGKESAPTPDQLQILKNKRSEYLNALQGNDENQVKWHLACIESEIFQSYLPRIKELYTPLKADEFANVGSRIARIDITKWVVDPAEDSIEKLCSVYQVLSGEECSVALIYHRDESQCRVQLAVCNNKKDQEDPSIVQELSKRLKDALRGNFPGAICGEPVQEGWIQNDETEGASVAVVSNLATEKSERFISQSIEKLLDGIVPRAEDGPAAYTIVLLADPVLNNADYLQNLYNQYTVISPFAQVQKQISISDSTSIMSTANVGGNASLNAGGSVGGGTKLENNEDDKPNGRVHAGVSFGLSAGLQVGYSAGTTLQTGKNEGQTLTYSNFEIKHCMERIEQQMKRMEQCQALGMWNFAAYIISKDYSTAQNVAHMYVSLTQGEESYLEPSAINVWKGGDSNNSESEMAMAICNSLQHLQHPEFCLDPDKSEDTLFYPALVDATIMVSGGELAHALNFPRKSVSGLPVYECVPFGREVVLHSEDTEGRNRPSKKPEAVNLGKIYHMRAKEKTDVFLLKDSLTAHTFITGSTGTGKSNTVYTLLNRLCPEHKECVVEKDTTHFLVIEPAKGEYKQVFGGRSDVSVYGTNFKMANLLRLNPFSFPDEIHVLEHIDRLVEIFNACWPMYAAMPAVLKDAIESSYVSCGWSLTHSVCEPKRFPTFETLLKKLPEIMDSSAYSKDTKGDYTGALVTRVKSLTNGINGQIFCSGEELSSEQLFDQNVIVDLSRVGSMETKSLLMGILMIKLQEYRMAKADETNAGLRHVTVLEEAHNLLRRTSSEQSQDSSNLQGKSVEMLANAIAEMRTYGEGFIIADQAPGLLDMAVIRNTNTKIIMRLPDESDRMLVGKAAGLTDDQIVELSKLDCGVAAVFQNHWLEAVLCKVDEFPKEEKKPLSYSGNTPVETLQKGAPRMNVFFEKLLGKPTDTELSDEEVDKVRTWIDSLDAGRITKLRLISVLEAQEKQEFPDKGELLYRIVNGNDFLKYAGTVSDREVGMRVIDQKIMEMLEVSMTLAEEIRKQVFIFAADRINRMPQHNELLYYGGVK